MAKIFLLLASTFGFLSVAIGAFGAHRLKPYLLEIGRYDTFQTAVEYQFFHTMALLAVSVLMLAKHDHQQLLISAAWMFVAGIFVFSGSLYLLCATNIGKWGAVTPFGGVMFMIGWALLTYFAIKTF